MKAKRFILALAGLLVLLLGMLVPFELPACSTFKLQKGDELIYGHNLNANGIDVPGLVFINKRGIFKTGRTWSELSRRDRANPSSLAWIARYGSVTFNTFGKDLPDGGMNEAGLYIWEMGLGHAEVLYPKNNSLPKLNQMHWMQYVLDNFSTVEQAVGCARDIEIDGWGWHFFVGDVHGNCAAIDFVDNKVVVHQGADMPVPGLFNALYEREIEWSRYFKGFGGVYDPRLDDPTVPRYVKTAVLLQEYDPRQNAVEYGFHILDNIFVTEVADWSVLFDVRNGIVYFRTSLNRQIKKFAVKGLDFSSATPALILNIDIGESGDVGERFESFSAERLARFIETLPLPDEFWEMGGLDKAEMIKRLATHTVFAQAPENQNFAGRWQGKSGDKVAWELALFTKHDAVRGEITGGKGMAERTPIEHVRMTGDQLVFTFRGKGEGNFVEGKALIDGGKMGLELWGIEGPYGNFALARE